MKIRLLAATLLMAACSGCIVNTSGVRTEDSTLVTDNACFACHLHCLGQACRTTDDGFIQAQVEIQNADTSDFDLQYRFQWLDGDGMLLPESSSVWRHAVAHGRDKFFLTGVSENRMAKDFRLVVREL